MDARTEAAKFAAYTWYTECRAGQPSPTEAARFARENWTAFLPVAHEGWGRLLLWVAQARPTHQRPPTAGSRPTKRKLAVGV
jgi:hypothetical protein